jgi:hypothetical protein
MWSGTTPPDQVGLRWQSTGSSRASPDSLTASYIRSVHARASWAPRSLRLARPHTPQTMSCVYCFTARLGDLLLMEPILPFRCTARLGDVLPRLLRKAPLHRPGASLLLITNREGAFAADIERRKYKVITKVVLVVTMVGVPKIYGIFISISHVFPLDPKPQSY